MTDVITKAIFVDVDGPMIPARAMFLPGQTGIYSVFDPCATSMLLQLLDKSGAKIVISSTWGSQGYNKIVELFEKNGINRSYLHDDWRTPRKMSSYRCHEIAWWLDNHPEITHYVAIEDEDLEPAFVPNAVKCDTYEGFSFRNYKECTAFLGIEGQIRTGSSIEETMTFVNWMRQAEMKRAAHYSNHPLHGKLMQMARDMFPYITPAQKEDEI